jgi:hypothetical protein
MDKLTKFEVKILSYLDKKIDNTSNKDQVFKILKDEFGLDKSEVLDLYRLWYYNKGTGDYDTIEVDREGPLLNFLNNISLLNSNVNEYIDELYDNNREKLDALIGDWFVLCNNYNTPCLDFGDESVTITLGRDEWERYFSGLGDDDLWKYYDAFSSYSDYYEEIETSEFDYVYTNDETVEHLETLAILSGLSEWPGKDGKKIEEQEVNDFLGEVLPKEYYERIVDDYIGEMSIVVTRARQDSVRKTYTNEIKYDTNKTRCRFGDYCIEIPYVELIEIVKEKNLLNLSELKDAEIQPDVDLDDAYYGEWLDNDGVDEVVTELNRSLKSTIEKITESEDIDLEELILNRKYVLDLLNKLGLKKITDTSQGEYYMGRNGLLTLHTNDIDFKNNKVKFTYDDQIHITPIEDLTNWVSGSVLDLNESVRFNKKVKLLQESYNLINKISIFDFDGTLMKTPHPEEGKKQWEEFTGKEYPHIGWWSKPESLDDAVFDIQPIENTVADYLIEKSNPSTLVIMLTGRIPHQAEQIEELLLLHNISFDEYHYKGNGDTLTSKFNTIKSLLNRFPNVKEIEMWEDREPHAIEFKKWGEENEVNLKVNLVTSDGQIIKGGVNDLVNESIDKKKIFFDKISKLINPPYFSDLESLGVPQSEWMPILNVVFGKEVHLDFYQQFIEVRDRNNGRLTYREWPNGDWSDFDKGVENLQIHTMGDINESVTNDLIDKVVPKLEPPYIYNLYSMGFDSTDSEKILSKLFGKMVHIYDDSVYNSSTNSVSKPTESRVHDIETGDVLYIEYYKGDSIDWIDWRD